MDLFILRPSVTELNERLHVYDQKLSDAHPFHEYLVAHLVKALSTSCGSDSEIGFSESRLQLETS